MTAQSLLVMASGTKIRKASQPVQIESSSASPIVQRNTAIVERDRALANLSVSNAYDSMDRDPSQALRHALDAWHHTPGSVDAHRAVLRAYYEAPGFPIRLLRKSGADWGTSDPWFSAAFLSDSTRIISRDLSRPATVLLVDLDGNTTKLETTSEIGRIPPVPTPDGAGFMVYERSRSAVVFYDLGGAEKQAVQTPAATALAFSEDGALFAVGWSGGDQYGVTVYSRDGAERRRFADLTNNVQDLAFSTDDETLAVAADKSAWLIPIGGGEVSKIDHPDYVTGVAFYTGDTADALLATTCWDSLPRIWWAASGRVMKSLKGHTSRTFCPRFSSDGESLATASWDGATRIWHGRNVVTEARLVLPGPGATSLVDWSRNDRWLAIAENETLSVWNLADRKTQSAPEVEAQIGLPRRDWAGDGYDLKGDYRGVELLKDSRPLVRLPTEFIDSVYSGTFSPAGGFVEVSSWRRPMYFPIHPEVIEHIVFVSSNFGKVPRSEQQP